MTWSSLTALLTTPVSTNAFSAPLTLMPVSSGIKSASLACSAPGSMVTIKSLTVHSPSAPCSTTFIEPARLPRKKSSVGLSSITSTSAMLSEMGSIICRWPGGRFLSSTISTGFPARVEERPPTTMRVAGELSLTTVDFPSTISLGASTLTEVHRICDAFCAYAWLAKTSEASSVRQYLLFTSVLPLALTRFNPNIPLCIIGCWLEAVVSARAVVNDLDAGPRLDGCGRSFRRLSFYTMYFFGTYLLDLCDCRHDRQVLFTEEL